MAAKNRIFGNIILALALSASLVFGLAAATQAAYPEKEITIVCPWPPGGSSDLISRSVAQYLKKHVGKTVVVMNRDGANGVIATTENRTTRPDGYTLLQGTNGLFVTQPLTQANLAYKMDDFEFLIGLTNEPILLLVPAESPYKSIDDLVKTAKAEKKVIRFGNSGTGGIPALCGAYFFGNAGVKFQPIPFKGGAPVLTAILGKHVDAGVVHPGEAIPHIKAGTMRPLVISSPRRFEGLPDVPTMKEKGFDIDLAVRKYIFAPKGLPDTVKKVLLPALEKTVKEEGFLKTMADANLMVEIMTGDQVRQSMLKTIPVVKKLLEEMPKAQ
jgi:tripartite-type tricarboxylate transporter receptor subunit TctC